MRTLRTFYLAAIERLMTEALGSSVPPGLVDAVNNEVSISLHIAGKRVSFIKELWPSQRGYELRFYLGNDGGAETDDGTS